MSTRDEKEQRDAILARDPELSPTGRRLEGPRMRRFVMTQKYRVKFSGWSGTMMGAGVDYAHLEVLVLVQMRVWQWPSQKNIDVFKECA